jgi:hypothetical protein
MRFNCLAWSDPSILWICTAAESVQGFARESVMHFFSAKCFTWWKRKARLPGLVGSAGGKPHRKEFPNCL